MEQGAGCVAIRIIHIIHPHWTESNQSQSVLHSIGAGTGVINHSIRSRSVALAADTIIR